SRYSPARARGPGAPAPAWGGELGKTLPELPAARRARLIEAWSLSELEFEALRNAGALDAVEATVAAGASPADARKWWLGELARRANDAGLDVPELPITPADVARVAELVAAGTLNDRLARQVIDAVLDGEGTPDEVV